MRPAQIIAMCLLLASCAAAPPARVCPLPRAAALPPLAAATAPWDQLTHASPQHTLLESLAGRFEARSRFWIYPGAKPGAPPLETTARVDNRLQFQGRFLVQDFRYPDTPFVGTGYYGYDNLRRRYQYVWLDSAITGIEMLEGARDGADNAITFQGRELDPITRREIAVRMVLRVESAERHSLERYEAGPEGCEQKASETTFVRLP